MSAWENCPLGLSFGINNDQSLLYYVVHTNGMVRECSGAAKVLFLYLWWGDKKGGGGSCYWQGSNFCLGLESGKMVIIHQ